VPLPHELFPQAPVPQLPPPQLAVPHRCWVAAAPLPLLLEFFRLLQPWVARVSPPSVSAMASPAMLTVFFSSFMESFRRPAPYLRSRALGHRATTESGRYTPRGADRPLL
jgi:hypothetical protein